MACYNFAAHYKVAGNCGACGRHVLLKKGYCRPCWCQAHLERTHGPGHPLAPWVAKVRHHQLFFAGIHPGLKSYTAPPKAFPRRHDEKGRPRKPPPPAAPRPLVDAVQLSLFDELGQRLYQWGRIDLRRDPPPANPWLGRGLHVAHTLAETRGFGAAMRRGVNRVLVTLLTDYTGAERIHLSDFIGLVRAHGHCVDAAIEVLDQMGIFDDDRPPTFESWLDAKLEPLPPGIRGEVRRWVVEQGYGTAAALPGLARPSPTSIRSCPRSRSGPPVTTTFERSPATRFSPTSGSCWAGSAR
jgi:hypothetical protein